MDELSEKIAMYKALGNPVFESVSIGPQWEWRLESVFGFTFWEEDFITLFGNT